MPPAETNSRAEWQQQLQQPPTGLAGPANELKKMSTKVVPFTSAASIDVSGAPSPPHQALKVSLYSSLK